MSENNGVAYSSHVKLSNTTSSGVSTLKARVTSVEKNQSNLDEKAEQIRCQFLDLEKTMAERAAAIESKLKVSDDKIDKHNGRMMNIVSGVIFLFIVTSVGMFFDYFKNNQERYEKFIDKVTELENRSYSKEEIDKDFYKKAEIDSKQSIFNNCVLREGGVWKCLK